MTDASAHRILRWHAATGTTETLATAPALTPVILAAAGPGDVMLLESGGHFAQFDPAHPGSPIPVAHQASVNAPVLFPAGAHSTLNALRPLLSATEGFPTSAGVTLPAPRDLRPLLYASQFAVFEPGVPRLLASEDEARIYRYTIQPASGTSTRSATATLFAEARGSSVVEDRQGNVYVAGDQVLVFDRSGHQTGVLELPTRPTALAIVGKDQQTLYIAGRSALYSIPLAAAPAGK